MKPYYQDSAVTIYHGDAREVVPRLGFVDLIVTDPPYGMSRFATDIDGYLEIAGGVIREALNHLPIDADGFAFCATRDIALLTNASRWPLYRVLWLYKPNDCTFPLDGWLLTSEAILWFRKGKGNLHERRPFRHDCYVHTAVGQEGVEGHPTVKPLSVVKDIASRCIPEGTILDPFMGSGTTLRAAKELGRRAIGIEIEEKYCEIAAHRMEQEVLPLKQVEAVQQDLPREEASDEVL